MVEIENNNLYLMLVVSVHVITSGVWSKYIICYFAIVGTSSNDSNWPKDITLHSCSLYRPGVLAKVLTKQLCKWLLLVRLILLPRFGQQYFINTVCIGCLQVAWDEDLLLFSRNAENRQKNIRDVWFRTILYSIYIFLFDPYVWHWYKINKHFAIMF